MFTEVLDVGAGIAGAPGLAAGYLVSPILAAAVGVAGVHAGAPSFPIVSPEPTSLSCCCFCS